jgi:hypothetical protein
LATPIVLLLISPLGDHTVLHTAHEIFAPAAGTGAVRGNAPNIELVILSSVDHLKSDSRLSNGHVNFVKKTRETTTVRAKEEIH